MGNLHLRFDEGRAGRATRVAFSPTLPLRHHRKIRHPKQKPSMKGKTKQDHPSPRRDPAFLFSASPTGRIDYGRLSLELAAGLLFWRYFLRSCLFRPGCVNCG